MKTLHGSFQTRDTQLRHIHRSGFVLCSPRTTLFSLYFTEMKLDHIYAPQNSISAQISRQKLILLFTRNTYAIDECM
jgi:hypothetical protein